MNYLLYRMINDYEPCPALQNWANLCQNGPVQPMSKRQGRDGPQEIGRPATIAEGGVLPSSTAKSPMRPDVGTQAQFKKCRPPKAYRCDTSSDLVLVWMKATGGRGRALPCAAKATARPRTRSLYCDLSSVRSSMGHYRLCLLDGGK